MGGGGKEEGTRRRQRGDGGVSGRRVGWNCGVGEGGLVCQVTE